MSTVSVRAYAKINLNLGIVGKREDGYHLLDSLMQTISISDEITLKKASSGIKINARGKEIPTGADNTMYKTAAIMLEEYGLTGGLVIDIDKRIPVCAGLGGPSADSAAVIRGINKLWDLNLSVSEMERIGVRIGADVPFLITGGKAACRGIGEVITPMETEPLMLIIAKPNVSVSTKWAYGRFDEIGESKGSEDGGYYNDFESVVFPEYPVIKDIKETMIKNGAKAALMSGSGASVFGIFGDETERKDCKNILWESFPGAEIILAETVGKQVVQEGLK